MKRTFSLAKINKDVDIRFLKQGEILHSENLRFRGVGEDGVARSIKGNSIVSDVAIDGMKCNGAVHDKNKDRIFYWLTDNNGNDKVVLYNLVSKTTRILLEGDLNLNSNNLVLTANEINGILSWVDSGRNNPRRINVDRNYDNFTEDDISVIRKPPFEEPKILLKLNPEVDSNELDERILHFATRYRYEDNEYSSISFYSDAGFYPQGFSWDKGSVNNAGMVNLYNEIEVSFNTGGPRVKEVDLLYRESNNSTVYRLRKFNKEDEGWGDNEVRTFTFSNSKAIDVIPPEDVNALYYNVPDKPFTQALIFNRLVYGNYYEGFDLVDNQGQRIVMEMFLEHVVNETEPPTIVNEVVDGESHITFSNLNEGALYEFNINLVGELIDDELDLDQLSAPNYNGLFYLRLSRDYSSVQELGESQELRDFRNEINQDILQSINHIPNANIFTHNPIMMQYSAPDKLIMGRFEFTAEIDTTPYDIDETPDDTLRGLLIHSDSIVREITNSRKPTVKSNRGYEACIYYYDKWNRQSSALITDDNTIFVPHKNAIDQNKIKISIAHNPPKSAVKYKIGIKEGRLPYETIYAYEYYEDADFRYIKLDSENKDKVKVGDKIIPKIDESGFYELYQPIDVLEVGLKQEDFIEESFGSNQSSIKESAGLYMKIKAASLDVTFNRHNNYEYNDTESECSNGDRPSLFLTEPFSERDLTEIPSFEEYSDANGDAFYQEAGGSLVGMWYKLVRRYAELMMENTYHIPIPRGSVLEMDLSSTHGDDRPITDTVRFVAERDYDSILEWASEIQLENHDIEIGENLYINEEWYNEQAWEIRRAGGIFRDIKIARMLNHLNLYAGFAYMKITGEYEGGGCLINNYGRLNYRISLEREIQLGSKGLVVFETLPEINNEHIFYETHETFPIIDGKHIGKDQDQTDTNPAVITLDYYNAYTFSNGVESWKIRDRFINTDVAGKSLNSKFRGITVLEEEFKQIHREADLIYGGVYNDDLRYNGLNAFNPSLGNWKTLDKEKGSVQRIMSRESDLLVFQTEKTGQVMYGKSVLYDQAGLSVVQQTEDVLGAYRPFAGEYGISYNPESLASWGTVIYHTDRKRGAIMRLSNSGYHEIDRYGMNSFFDELLDLRHTGSKIDRILGGYDPKNSEYLINIDNGLWAFYEPENSFPTKWTYEPDFILNANNKLFTWKDGIMYEHETNDNHGEFYFNQTECKIRFAFNEHPNWDKVWKELSIHGNQAWDTLIKTNMTETQILDPEYSHEESFYYAYTRMDVSENSRDFLPLGTITAINGNIVEVNGMSELVSVGDVAATESQVIGTIELIQENKVTLENIGALQVNDFLIARKPSRIDGSYMRGYYLDVEMTKVPTTPIELYSVESEEFISK